MENYRQLQEELAVTAMTLVAEFADLPAGSVLRNFARAVRFTRQVEASPDRISEQAATITRMALGRRQAFPYAMAQGA